MNGNLWIAIGSLSAAAAVGMGAFGAHGLEDRLQRLETNDIFQVAAQYHMYHSLALLFAGSLAHRGGSTSLRVAAWAFAVGVLLFSGSLYALALSGVTRLGAITPFGGTAFLVGWVALAVAAFRTPSAP